ncbi:MAG: bifunctional precorrin-2 dehydrogenase/sirohydrochlorin ferrochelatase [Candidatus Latescibacteria bacterium]|nr:bifunctional precorrin-2 dehydrogenase/sirohydrochlorin ferrochelatase [Candidatus Latescibacterota bacterium]
MSQSPNPYFQVGLDVFGRTCLVIGGGAEAADKTARLLEAGARLRVVSPALCPRLQEWADQGRLDHHARPWQPADLDGVWLVLNTAGDPLLADQVYALARERRLLINTYDRPECSNLGMAALVHPGHLRLSISTSGASPALASRLRADLEQVFDSEFVDYLDLLAQVRTHLQKTADQTTRIRLLKELVAEFGLEAKLHYPEGWRERMKGLLAGDPAAGG